MRYGIALVTSLLIIGVGTLYVRQANRSFEVKFHQILRDARTAGQLPPEFDAEQANFEDFGVNLPDSEMRRMDVVHFLIRWRFVLIPMVLLASLGIARISKQKRP